MRYNDNDRFKTSCEQDVTVAYFAESFVKRRIVDKRNPGQPSR
jgi:hypothetical protein